MVADSKSKEQQCFESRWICGRRHAGGGPLNAQSLPVDALQPSAINAIAAENSSAPSPYSEC